MLLNVDTTLFATDAANGDVTFERTVRSVTDGANSLTVNATGDTLFRGKVGDNAQRLESLTTDAAPFVAAGVTRIEINTLAAEVSINTTADQIYNDPVVFDSPNDQTTLQGDDITFNNTIGGAAALTENVDIAVSGEANFNGAVIVPQELLSLEVSDAVGGGGGGPKTNIRTPVFNGGNVVFNTPVCLDSPTDLTTFNVANLTFNSTLDGIDPDEESIVVNATGITLFGGNVGVTGRLVAITTDPLGTTRFGRPVAGTPVTVRTQRAQLYRDDVVLNVDTTLEASDAVTPANGDVTFEKTITAKDDNAQFLVVNATDVSRFEGNVGAAAQRLESLTTDATPFVPSGVTQFGKLAAGAAVEVRTAGPQLYRDDVLLHVDTTLFADDGANGDVTFEKTIRSATDGETALSSTPRAIPCSEARSAYQTAVVESACSFSEQIFRPLRRSARHELKSARRLTKHPSVRQRIRRSTIR